MTVSFEDEHPEGKNGSTFVSTFDSEVSFSMIDVSADHNGMPARFSTGGGLSKSFLYPGGSRSDEAGRSSKTLLASSRKGQRWTA